MAAAATLLSAAPASQAWAQTRPSAPANASAEWKVDSAVLIYSESGGRIRAVEPVISARRTDGNEVSTGLKLTLDSLTGASPNGAAPQPAAQTFTSPSGNSRFTVAAGATPLDPSFKDTRVALAISRERPFGDNRRLSLAGNVSVEYDFRSFGVSAALAQDFNDKNTTLSMGLALEGNILKPVGGTPVGLQPTFTAQAPRQKDGNRTVVDVLLGATQIINRQWLMQVNLGLGQGSGTHTDPYKLLSVVDGASGLVTGDRYVTEQRPDKRARVSLFWQNKLHVAGDVVDVSYRYYRDDWGVRAHTLDTRYRWELGGGLHLEPRWRHHTQSAADFWRGWLVEGPDWNSTNHSGPHPALSADPRLAAFKADTIGLKAGLITASGSEWTLRLESYRQKLERPAGAVGALQTLDLAPTVKATMLMLGYNRSF